jgi:hypothetical protein
VTTRAKLAVALLTALAGATASSTAAVAEPAAPLDDASILGDRSSALRVVAVSTRITSFDQDGHGYQAQGAATPSAPGSERLTVLEPQLLIEAAQGDRVRHTVRLPVDVVTNASADAIDVVSSASRHVEAGSIEWTTRYRSDPATEIAVMSGLHLENPFRSWQGGLAGSRAFAGGATVLSASVLQVTDWFDRFDIHGGRFGRTDRSSTTASLGLTQVLTPTTLANINYGVTLQHGELGNTWNSVPLTTLERGPELLPRERLRHALVVRAAQYLPWDGALHAYYRFYADDWGNRAHSVQAELLQRLTPRLLVGALYRFHRQTGVDFFSTLADPAWALRTADSDLAPFDAHTVGGHVALDIPLSRGTESKGESGELRAIRLELGYERYFRDNDLTMNVATVATGYRF